MHIIHKIIHIRNILCISKIILCSLEENENLTWEEFVNKKRDSHKKLKIQMANAYMNTIAGELWLLAHCLQYYTPLDTKPMRQIRLIQTWGWKIQNPPFSHC